MFAWRRRWDCRLDILQKPITIFYSRQIVSNLLKMYDDEEDQQNSERSDNPDEIGSDPRMLVLSPQNVHTGWRTVVVPWQDQSLSLEFFGVPLPPSPTTAIRIERFSVFHLGRSIRFRLLSHIPELALTLSPPINFLSLRNVSRLDLGRIDMPLDFGILRNLPCLTHLPEPMSHIDVSHIIPHARKPYFPSHKHAMKPYFPPLTQSLGLFCLCGFFVWLFLFFDIGMADFLLALFIFWFFNFFDFFLLFCNYLAQHVYQAWGEATGVAVPCPVHANVRDVETLEGLFYSLKNWGRLLYIILKLSIKNLRVRIPIILNYFKISNIIYNIFQIFEDAAVRHCPPIDPSSANVDNFLSDDDFEIGDGIDKFLCDYDFERGDLSENVGSPNDLICLSRTTETLEGRIEPTWPEYQSANPALEQHRAILPHTVPHVMARNNAVTVTTLQMETDKSSLLSPQCLSGSIAQDNLAQSCPLVTTEGCFLEEGRSPSIELPCSNPALKLPTVTTAQVMPNLAKNCTTTSSQKKITSTELLPLIGLTREAAAEKIGVSIPTFKRQCRLNSIFRWPHYRNKEQCLSLQQKLAADSDQGAAGAFDHFVTGSHTGAIGLNHHNSPCSKPAKRQRVKKTSPSCKTPSTVATCSDPAPAPMQAMSTFPQIMPHPRAGQDARIEISKTTEDILIQSVEGVTTRSCSSPQKQAGSDVPSTSSPKHFHCTEIMNQMLESSHPASKGQLQEQSTFHLQKQNAGTATIKATYGDKTVRVPPPATSGIVKLKEELARRLELEHGSFYVEYEDEDHDWILIACDDVLQECLTFSRDNRVIRLAVRDEVVNSQNSGKAREC